MSHYEVSDQDILSFLRTNWRSYPSQISLLQAAVQAFWPEGASPEASERVVRLCLLENQLAVPLVSKSLLPSSKTE